MYCIAKLSIQPIYHNRIQSRSYDWVSHDAYFYLRALLYLSKLSCSLIYSSPCHHLLSYTMKLHASTKPHTFPVLKLPGNSLNGINKTTAVSLEIEHLSIIFLNVILVKWHMELCMLNCYEIIWGGGEYIYFCKLLKLCCKFWQFCVAIATEVRQHWSLTAIPCQQVEPWGLQDSWLWSLRTSTTGSIYTGLG